MKKLMALLLAALMVFSMAAVAETAEPAETAEANAAFVSGSNIVLRLYDEDGNAQEIPLEDFKYFVGIDTVDGVNFMFELDQGEDDVLAAVLCRMIDNKLQYCLSNVDRTFEIDLSEYPGADVEALVPELRALLPSLLANTVDKIPAVEIPAFDMTALFGGYITDTADVEGATASEFVVPAEDVSAILNMILEIVKSSADSIPQGKQAVDMLDELVKNISFEIKGDIAATEEGQITNIGLYPVSEGETSETALISATITSTVNLLNIDLYTTSEEGEANTVATLSIGSDPDANTMVFTVDLGDIGNLNVYLDQENDLQNIYLSAAIAGVNGSARMSYGIVDDEDYLAFDCSVDGIGSISSVTTGSLQDETTYAAHVDVEQETEDIKLGLSCDSIVSLFDLGLAALEMPEEITDEYPTDDEMDAFVQPIVDYLSDVFGTNETDAEDEDVEEDIEDDIEEDIEEDDAEDDDDAFDTDEGEPYEVSAA